MKNSSKWFKLGLGVILSLVIIIWAIWFLDWSAVLQILADVHYGWVLLATVSVLLTIWARAKRWGVLLSPSVFGYQSLLGAMLLGQVINSMVPARAGDVARAYIIGQSAGISKTRAIGTIAVEKLWDLIMLLLFMTFLSWYFPLPQWLAGPAKGLTIFTVMGVAMLGTILWQQERAVRWMKNLEPWLPQAIYLRLITLAQNLLLGFAGLKNHRQIIAAGMYSLLVWGVGGVTNYLLFNAFGLSLSIIAALVLMVALQAGVAVPSLPGKIGVFEGICVVVLALFDVPYPLAFSYGLILHGIVFLPPVVLAAILAWRLSLLDNNIKILTGGNPVF